VGYVNCRRMVGVCCGNGGKFVGVDSVNCGKMVGVGCGNGGKIVGVG
jgi:hypothetical protein